MGQGCLLPPLVYTRGMKKRSHLEQIIDATDKALGTKPAQRADAKPAKQSNLSDFASRKASPAAKPAKPAKPAPGATAKAVKQLSKGDW